MELKKLIRKLTTLEIEMKTIDRELERCDVQGLRIENKTMINLMIKGAKIQGAIDILNDLLDDLSK